MSLTSIREAPKRLGSCCVTVALLGSLISSVVRAESANPLGELNQKLESLELDTSKGVPLENFVLRKDAMRLELKKGVLFFSQPVEGERFGAFFHGEGTFSFVPPNTIHQKEFYRNLRSEFGEAKAVAQLEDIAVHRVVFFTTDATFGSLFSQLSEEVVAVGELEQTFQERWVALRQLVLPIFMPRLDPIIAPLLNLVGPKNPERAFIAEIDTGDNRYGWLTYGFSPASLEEIILLKHTKLSFTADALRLPEVLAWFNRTEDLQRPFAERFEYQHRIDEIESRAELEVEPSTFLLKAQFTLRFRSLVDNLEAVALTLLKEFSEREEITVHRVLDANGNELPFFHSPIKILFRLKDPLGEGEIGEVTFHYEGNFINILSALKFIEIPPMGSLPPELNFLPSSPQTYTLLNSPWYPQNGLFEDRRMIDWTIKVPKPLRAAASGTTVKRWKEGLYNALRTVEKTPIFFPAIIFGKYELHSGKSRDGDTTINIYTLPKQQGKMKPILSETQSILDYYEQLYGPYPYEELDIVQMAFFLGFAQAPAGLNQLTGETFLKTVEVANLMEFAPPYINPGEFRDYFLPHEIAHQWWGENVWAKTLRHDNIISESFAEYSSALFIQQRYGDKRFGEILTKRWKRDIDRQPQKDRRPLYFPNPTTWYSTGPYMLHMLRMGLALSGKEDKFFEALRSFQRRYGGENVLFHNFIETIEEVSEQQMDWFFDQWLYEEGYPTVRYRYDVTFGRDGQYIVQLHLRQDESEFKRLIIPVYFHMGTQAGRAARLMTEPKQSFVFKLSRQPTKVTLDDHHTCLAEFIEEQ